MPSNIHINVTVDLNQSIRIQLENGFIIKKALEQKLRTELHKQSGMQLAAPFQLFSTRKEAFISETRPFELLNNDDLIVIRGSSRSKNVNRRHEKRVDNAADEADTVDKKRKTSSTATKHKKKMDEFAAAASSAASTSSTASSSHAEIRAMCAGRLEYAILATLLHWAQQLPHCQTQIERLVCANAQAGAATTQKLSGCPPNRNQRDAMRPPGIDCGDNAEFVSDETGNKAGENSATPHQEEVKTEEKTDENSEVICQLEAMGFDVASCQQAALVCDGHVEQSVEWLLLNANNVDSSTESTNQNASSSSQLSSRLTESATENVTESVPIERELCKERDGGATQSSAVKFPPITATSDTVHIKLPLQNSQLLILCRNLVAFSEICQKRHLMMEQLLRLGFSTNQVVSTLKQNKFNSDEDAIESLLDKYGSSESFASSADIAMINETFGMDDFGWSLPAQDLIISSECQLYQRLIQDQTIHQGLLDEQSLIVLLALIEGFPDNLLENILEKLPENIISDLSLFDQFQAEKIIDEQKKRLSPQIQAMMHRIQQYIEHGLAGGGCQLVPQYF